MAGLPDQSDLRAPYSSGYQVNKTSIDFFNIKRHICTLNSLGEYKIA